MKSWGSRLASALWGDVVLWGIVGLCRLSAQKRKGRRWELGVPWSVEDRAGRPRSFSRNNHKTSSCTGLQVFSATELQKIQMEPQLGSQAVRWLFCAWGEVTA